MAEKTVHLVENGYYLLGNKSVAKCFMFKDEKDCARFKEKIDHHLKPLCDVTAFGFSKEEFQLLVRLKSRKTFEEYYKKKYDYEPKSGDIIPKTTYIFAQAMSNLQSGYVKYFNFRHGRDGGLMGARYFRELIESESHLDRLISSINKLIVRNPRSAIWTFRRKEDGFELEAINKSVMRSSYRCYSERGVNAELSCFCHRNSLVLRGHFENLPPKRLLFKNKQENIKNLLAFMFMRVTSD